MELSRRHLLSSTAALTTTSLLPSRPALAEEFTNMPSSDVVKFGFTVAQSGAFADEGAEELRAFELAVDHINGVGDGGMLNTMRPLALQGNGVLGRRVEYVVADTATRPSTAVENSTALIENEGVTMLTGGSTSGVAIALQTLSQEKGVIFMAGLTHSNDTTGTDGVKNSFRHHINARMSNSALAKYLVDQYGGTRRVYYLSADYNWSYQNETGFRTVFEAAGWETADRIRTPLSQQDFSSYLAPIADSGADTLIMSQYGANMLNMVSAIEQSGLKDRIINGNQFVVGLPLYSDLMIRGAGAAAEGIFGTVNWHSSFSDAASEAFKASFGERYGFMPSSAAHTCYVQTLLYADACERAGTFNPCRIVAALQDHQFSGLGNGSCDYRAADHQCFKDVPVVKATGTGSSMHELLNVEATMTKSDVEYSIDESGADHGACFNGVESVEVNETSSNIGVSGGSESNESSGGGSIALGGLAVLGAAMINRRAQQSECTDQT